MRHASTGSVAAMILMAGASLAPTESVKVGDKAPPLNIERLLQAPGNDAADWGKLEGRVVVLEFWATWCTPCVKEIPRLNDLVERFRDRVQFISITDEQEPAIKQFLRHRPIKGWIGLDTDRSAFEAYGVQSIPVTVIVQRDGRMAARTRPERINASLLQDVIEGKELHPADDDVGAGAQDPRMAKALAMIERMRSGASNESDSDADSRSDSDQPPLVKALIRPAFKRGWSAMTGDTWFEVHDESLRRILAFAYEKNGLNTIPIRKLPMEDHIDGPDSVLNERYDVIVKVSSGRGEHRAALMRAALEASFDIEKQPRPEDVYVLKIPDGAKPELEEAVSTGPPSFLSEPGRLLIIGVDADRFCSELGDIIRKPVIDGTGVTGPYVWDLKYEAENPLSIVPAVRKQIGFELVMEKRLVDSIIVKGKAATAVDGD